MRNLPKVSKQQRPSLGVEKAALNYDLRRKILKNCEFQKLMDGVNYWFQIESKKLDWSVTSKVGSLDNAQHKPGGGEKKVSLLYIIQQVSVVDDQDSTGKLILNGWLVMKHISCQEIIMWSLNA